MNVHDITCAGNGLNLSHAYAYGQESDSNLLSSHDSTCGCGHGCDLLSHGCVYDPHRGSDLLSYEGGILLASHDTKKPKQKGRVLDKRVSYNSH